MISERAVKLLTDARAPGQTILSFVGAIDEEEFQQKRIYQAAVEREFITVGEALAAHRREHPDVARRIEPLPRFIAFRNVIIHRFDQVDTEVVWSAVQDKLTGLLDQIEDVLKEVEASPKTD